MTLSDEVRHVLHRAVVGARQAGHPILTPEHLALELIVEKETATYLERCGTNLVAVEARLREFLGKIESRNDPESETTPTATFQRIIGNAVQRIEGDHREFLMLQDLFLAVIDERRSIASAAILEATQEPQMFEELRTYRSDEERGAI